MEGDLGAVQKELNFVPLIADVLTKFNNQSPESAHKDRQDLVHLVNKFNKQHEQLLKSVNGLSGTDLSAHEQRELYEQCERELKRKQALLEKYRTLIANIETPDHQCGNSE